MKILFMGTPDFAQKSLIKLVENKKEVVGVICNPDKPKGRGHKLSFPPVKESAISYNIPVYQPESLRNNAILDLLSELNPDIIVVVAYGKILPEYVLKFPKYGCINVHGSLLPKYRGAAPIQWSVINGDKKTGVTTMMMDKGLDTGDMLLTEETDILEDETSEELFERLAVVGADLLIKTLEGIENNTLSRNPQNNDAATYAPMINKQMACIDWNKSAKSIYHLVLGMNSWPMAYTYYNSLPVKVSRTIYDSSTSDKPNGEILGLVKGKGLAVSCSSGTLYITEAQFSGSKRMKIEDYLRGHDILIGSNFE